MLTCRFMESSTAEGFPPRWRTHRRRLVLHKNLTRRVKCGNTHDRTKLRLNRNEGRGEKKRVVEESMKEESMNWESEEWEIVGKRDRYSEKGNEVGSEGGRKEGGRAGKYLLAKLH